MFKNAKLKRKAPIIINNLIIMIAVIGADLRRAHSSKHKKCHHLKIRISVIIKQTWVILFAVQRVTYSILKKETDLHN